MKKLKFLSGINGIKVELDKDLSRYSTMRLNAVGDLITIRDIKSAVEVIQALKKENLDYLILGMGANTLLKEKIEIPYLHLDLDFDNNYLNKEKESYSLPASVKLSLLTSHAIKFNLVGWEVFTGIPATIGGAIFMNAGTKLGEFKKIIEEVTYINQEGKIITRKISEDDLSYRKNNFLKDGEIIVQATIKNLGRDSSISKIIKDYLKLRKETQPLNKLTCGCIFKNKIVNNSDQTTTVYRAGHYIDITGLKGFQYNKLRISPVHANFIENLGGATYSDMVEFIKIIQQKLVNKHGIFFETEVRL
jgi:UDP-N-acetylmuramate dehydrogenase